MDPQPTHGELPAIQGEILTLVHQLDLILIQLRRLQSRIDPGDDEAMIESTAPPSLAFEIHGVLDLAGDEIARGTALLRQAGVDTEETVRRQFFRLLEEQAAEPAEPAEPAESPTAAAVKRSPGNGSPTPGSPKNGSTEPERS